MKSLPLPARECLQLARVGDPWAHGPAGRPGSATWGWPVSQSDSPFICAMESHLPKQIQHVDTPQDRGPQLPGSGVIWGGADTVIIETKCTMNVMPLNHPETIPSTSPPPNPWSLGKLPFTKANPGTKRLGTAALSVAQNDRQGWGVRREWARHRGPLNCCPGNSVNLLLGKC